MATEPDYYIETFDTGARPYPWRLEIRRRSKPMGVELARVVTSHKHRQNSQANMRLGDFW